MKHRGNNGELMEPPKRVWYVEKSFFFNSSLSTLINDIKRLAYINTKLVSAGISIIR